MFKRLFFIAFLLLALSVPVLATVRNIPIQVEKGSGIPNLESNQVYGEILEISATDVLLHTAEGDWRLKLAKEVQINCNSMPAEWRALRPVYENAYCEACVFLNAEREVSEVRGFYYGQECLIEDWTAQGNQLHLKLVTVEGEQRFESVIAAGARLPRQRDWLAAGEVVFVLFNTTGETRGIYLVP